MKIPKFKTIEEERKFWDTHSVTDYLSDLRTTKEVVFQRPPLRRKFQIRLDDDTVRKLKKLANKKGTDVSTIIRKIDSTAFEERMKSA
jgi:hypothetical protein